ncbi:MAG: hypothetical protein WBM48_00995 [Polyangiales bacterium]
MLIFKSRHGRAMAFAKSAAHGHVPFSPRTYDLRQAITVVVDVVGEETQLEAQGFGAPNLLHSDECVVLESMAVVFPRVRLQHRFRSIQDDSDHTLPLCVKR